MPLRAACSTIPSNRSCWARTVGCCGASAYAKWEKIPTTSNPASHALFTKDGANWVLREIR